MTPEHLKTVIAANLPSLLSIAYRAGEAILEVYGTAFTVEQKEDRSPLTKADRRSHEIIVKELERLKDLQIPVLSEEGKNIPFSERAEWQLFWLVDPLDGTKEFIKRNGEFTVNIALIQKGRPLAGIIHVPVRNITYFAAEGLGSFRLDRAGEHADLLLPVLLETAVRLPLHTPEALRIAVIGSRSHMSEETAQYITELKSRYREVDFVSAGSSLKFCLIAEGSADVYPRFAPTMEWDTAAGQAIVELAGGVVLETSSQTPLRYNKEKLTNPWFLARGAGIRSA